MHVRKPLFVEVSGALHYGILSVLPFYCLFLNPLSRSGRLVAMLSTTASLIIILQHPDPPSLCIRCVVMGVCPNEAECTSNNHLCFCSKGSNCSHSRGVRSGLMAAKILEGGAEGATAGSADEAASRETTKRDTDPLVQASSAFRNEHLFGCRICRAEMC